MKKRLGFLHTSPVHIATFDKLLDERTNDVEAIHVVREDLLDRAIKEGGVSADLHKEINIVLRELVHDSDLVLCTCSSISQAAEDLGKSYATPVIRVDRPMAEKAIEANNIAVIAAIESTLAVTQGLLDELAFESNRKAKISIQVCQGAWEYFERGEQEKYFKKIAACIDELAKTNDLVVLAQASMAGAKTYCKTKKQVLASPELAIDYCLQKLLS